MFYTLSAFLIFCNVDRTTEVSLLNLISSCLSTVFIDSSYTTGYKCITYSIIIMMINNHNDYFFHIEVRW